MILYIYLYLHLNLLEGVFYCVVLPHDKLPLLLCAHVLSPHLFCVLCSELAYEAWIPELACDTQVFAATHQGVGFAAFSGGGDAIGVKVLLLATGDRNKSVGIELAWKNPVLLGKCIDIPALNNQSVFARDNLASDNGFTAGCKTPPSRSKCLVEYPSILDFGQVQYTIWLYFDIIMYGGRKQHF
jgi:hypothetical protein